jgi:hypothetical protein
MSASSSIRPEACQTPNKAIETDEKSARLIAKALGGR